MAPDDAPERDTPSNGNSNKYRYTRFWTKSGSEYLIDHLEKAWWRKSNPESPFVRTENGIFWNITTIVAGEEVSILGPPLEYGGFRLITTTLVVRVEHTRAFSLEPSI